MNSIVLLFLLAIFACVESGYIDFGPGVCVDSKGNYYDFYNPDVEVSSPEQCLEECIIAPSFLGLELYNYQGAQYCKCLYENGINATALGLDPSITYVDDDGDFHSGTGPISSSITVDSDYQYRCYKYIDENGLEFDRNFVFNSSAASFTLSAEVGEYYTNLTDQYEKAITLYGWNASATPISETLCGRGDTTELTEDRAKAISNLEPLAVSGSSSTYTQEFKLNLTDIATSDLYVSTSDTEGDIIFCARMDIMDITNETNKKSTFFAETFLTLFVNMTAGFTIASVAAKRLDPTEQDAEASFDIDACICDSGGTCSSENVVSQNTDFNVCIRSESDSVVVDAVNEMVISQDGEEKFTPVSGGNPSNTLTKINPYSDNGKKVTTRAISSFFSKVPPSPLRITGSVRLGFVSARRLLEKNVFATGEEDDEISTASFELSVGLKPLTDDTEEIATGEEEGEEEDVVIEGQEDDEGIANKGKSGSSVPVNVIVGVVGAVVCSLILVVGLRRAGSRSDTGVKVKYDDLKGSV